MHATENYVKSREGSRNRVKRAKDGSGNIRMGRERRWLKRWNFQKEGKSECGGVSVRMEVMEELKQADEVLKLYY